MDKRDRFLHGLLLGMCIGSLFGGALGVVWFAMHRPHWPVALFLPIFLAGLIIGEWEVRRG